MEKITSFTIDHTKLLPGIYISRIDGDVVTYDLRVCRPNCPPFMEVPAIHTIEHIFATLARNSEIKDKIIYFGPMGCRTGFYLLVREPVHSEVIDLIDKCFKSIADWQEEIPGTAPEECGNYLEHDLDGAKRIAEAYLKIISGWNEQKLDY